MDASLARTMSDPPKRPKGLKRFVPDIFKNKSKETRTTQLTSASLASTIAVSASAFPGALASTSALSQLAAQPPTRLSDVVVPSVPEQLTCGPAIDPAPISAAEESSALLSAPSAPAVPSTSQALIPDAASVDVPSSTPTPVSPQAPISADIAKRAKRLDIALNLLKMGEAVGEGGSVFGAPLKAVCKGLGTAVEAWRVSTLCPHGILGLTMYAQLKLSNDQDAIEILEEIAQDVTAITGDVDKMENPSAEIRDAVKEFKE